ncbi:hypothetical protein HYQ46_000241 [Verticillium longisporum]|nr:hypothetical protein HYQ46_000241 [Verticillium longisporum]
MNDGKKCGEGSRARSRACHGAALRSFHPPSPEDKDSKDNTGNPPLADGSNRIARHPTTSMTDRRTPLSIQVAPRA